MTTWNVAGCFQPGDANEIAYAMDVLVSDSRYTGDPRVLTRIAGESPRSLVVG